MRAAVYTKYGPPDVLEVREVEKPAPEENEILVRIYASSVTTADSAARSGKQFIARLAFGLTKPKKSILGTEFSGVIEAIGKNVRQFKPGDKIYAASGTDFGAHAEYICLPEKGAIALMPKNMDFAEAAAICEGGLTALPFIRDKGRIQSGQSILINGATGSVGTSAVQIAKYFGAEVTGVCSTANIELAESLGADNVIDYTKEDFTKSGATYDIIFDAAGKSSFLRCKDSLKTNGIYLKTVPTLSIFLQMLWTSRIGSRKAIIAFMGLRPSKDKTEDLIFLGELFESGKIKAVIDRQYPLEEISEAHRYIDTGKKSGNVVLILK